MYFPTGKTLVQDRRDLGDGQCLNERGHHSCSLAGGCPLLIQQQLETITQHPGRSGLPGGFLIRFIFGVRALVVLLRDLLRDPDGGFGASRFLSSWMSQQHSVPSVMAQELSFSRCFINVEDRII